MTIPLFVLMISMLPVTSSTEVRALAPEAIHEMVSELSLDERVTVFRDSLSSGLAAEIDDERIRAFMRGVGQEAQIKAVNQFLQENPTYETLLLKQERVGRRWNDKPDRMLVRYRAEPHAMYIRWERGGPNARRQLLFDSSKEPNRFLVNEGGLLGIVSITLDLDSSLVGRETNHRLTDLSFQTFLDYLEADRQVLLANGESTQPKVERVTEHRGERMWENVFETPGTEEYYAPKARFLFDMSTGVPRLVEIFETDGTLRERFEFKNIRWIALGDDVFDRDNDDYSF